MPSVATKKSESNGKPVTGFDKWMSEAPPRMGPIWKGPEIDGVTFSLLSRFLTCRERFRVHVIDGLRATDAFNHRMEYGNMWHACEEALANGGNVPKALLDYCEGLQAKYPLNQSDIDKWFRVCALQFPLYVDFWKRHGHVKDRTPIFAEKVFDVPYLLLSGRVVKLRGKFDSVDLIGKGKTAGVWLQENKTKGDVDETKLRRALKMDLQTMLYLVALTEPSDFKDWAKTDIKGVRYNVIKRPLSGGKGTIVRREATQGAKCPKCKGIGKCRPKGYTTDIRCPKCGGACRIGGKPEETLDAYYARLGKYIVNAPQEYFMRWQVEVSAADVQRFREKCLDPILENLCWWYDEVAGAELTNKIHDYGFPPSNWQHPYGVRNVLDEGGFADVDEHLATGSMVGLRRIENLFPELT